MRNIVIRYNSNNWVSENGGKWNKSWQITERERESVLINLIYFKLSIYLFIHLYIYQLLRYCVLRRSFFIENFISLFYSLMYVLNYIIVFIQPYLFFNIVQFMITCVRCQKQCALYFMLLYFMLLYLPFFTFTVLSDICENYYAKDTQCSNRHARH